MIDLELVLQSLEGRCHGNQEFSLIFGTWGTGTFGRWRKVHRRWLVAQPGELMSGCALQLVFNKLTVSQFWQSLIVHHSARVFHVFRVLCSMWAYWVAR